VREELSMWMLQITVVETQVATCYDPHTKKSLAWAMNHPLSQH
jgi:hypothetical protein